MQRGSGVLSLNGSGLVSRYGLIERQSLKVEFLLVTHPVMLGFISYTKIYLRPVKDNRVCEPRRPSRLWMLLPSRNFFIESNNLNEYSREYRGDFKYKPIFRGPRPPKVRRIHFQRHHVMQSVTMLQWARIIYYSWISNIIKILLVQNYVFWHSKHFCASRFLY